jgi:hypothetical protein
MSPAVRTASVASHAQALHHLATDYSHLPQPPAWRIDRFGIIGELFPASDALGIDQVKAWSDEFYSQIQVVQPCGDEPGWAIAFLIEWRVVVKCVLLGKRAGASR